MKEEGGQMREGEWGMAERFVYMCVHAVSDVIQHTAVQV